jgi:DNA mismatch repair protein MutS2
LLRREARERAREEAQVLIRRNTEKMENIIGELRRVGKEGRKTQSARKQMKETADALLGGIGIENEPLPLDEADVPTSLKRGDRVRVQSLGGAEGEVIADSANGEVAVQVGVMRVTVPLTAVRAAKRQPGALTPGPSPKLGKGEGGTRGGGGGDNLALAKATNISPEITLIAQRVDAALPKLDKYLDDGFAAGLDTARIIHGKGTGQLRKAIWEFLKGDNRVASYTLAHPDDGGAGATVVTFKE